MKTLHEAVNSIFNTKWTLNNNFCIEINPEKSNSLWSKIGLNNFDLNIYLKDFELPQYGAATIIEEWINDRYRMAQGTYDVSKISLTFNYQDEKTVNYILNDMNIVNKRYDQDIYYEVFVDQETLNKLITSLVNLFVSVG